MRCIKNRFSQVCVHDAVDHFMRRVLEGLGKVVLEAQVQFYET